MLAAAPETDASAPPDRLPFSRVLVAELWASDAPEIGIGELVEALRDRAFGAMLLVFAAPNIPPITLPGTSPVTSLPIMLVGAQLLIGWRALHVPAALARRRVSRAGFRSVVERLLPWLQRAERLARPRLAVMVSPLAERCVGLACLVLGVVLFLPIPLGNVPPGISIALMGLGLMERDGRMVGIGLAAAALSVAIATAVMMGALGLVLFALRGATGL